MRILVATALVITHDAANKNLFLRRSETVEMQRKMVATLIHSEDRNHIERYYDVIHTIIRLIMPYFVGVKSSTRPIL